MNNYFTIFSIDKNNKIIVKCDAPPLKAKLNHAKAVMLYTHKEKIQLERFSDQCRFYLSFVESLDLVLAILQEKNLSKQYTNIISLTFLPYNYTFELHIKGRRLFFVVTPVNLWDYPYRKRPQNYPSEEEFLSTIKPVACLEISFEVARRWYKQAKKISDAIQQNYADEYNASKKKDLLPKKYTISFKTKDITIIFKTTAPFKKLSCNDKASVSIIVHNQHFMMYQSISIVSCYEPLLKAFENFKQSCADINPVLQPLGLIFEQIRNNKLKDITSVRTWPGFKHTLWLIDKDNKTINLWLYPHNDELILEITPSYDNNQSFAYFRQYYSTIASVTINKKTIDQWHRRLVFLDNIIQKHHKRDCDD